MENCTLHCIELAGQLNYTQMCAYTRQQCIQDTVPFVQTYFCGLHESFMVLLFLGVPLFGILFKMLNVITEGFLAPCVTRFIDDFKISPALAGVTFLAFANSAPDVMTAIVAGSSDSSSTALIPFGSIFGACLFSSAFIFSCVVFSLPNQTLTVSMKEIALPLCFYIFGMLFIIIVTVAYGKMNAYLASVLLLAYGVYIVLVLRNERVEKKKQSLLMQGNEDDEEETPAERVDIVVVGDQAKQSFIERLNEAMGSILKTLLVRVIPPSTLQQWHPVNTVTSLVLSPLILALTQSVPGIFTATAGPIPIMVLLSLPALALLLYACWCLWREQDPSYMRAYAIYSFIISIACLAIVCSVLINLVQLVQLLSGINSVFLGLTLFAWANCIADYLSITHFAKTGNAQTAVAGIFSGQLFNFLTGFGVSLLMQSLDGEYQYRVFDFEGTKYEIISDVIVVTVIFSGLLYLVYTLVTVLRQRGVLMRREGLISRYYYLGFLAVACLLAVTTDFFDEITCDNLGFGPF